MAVALVRTIFRSHLSNSGDSDTELQASHESQLSFLPFRWTTRIPGNCLTGWIARGTSKLESHYQKNYYERSFSNSLIPILQENWNSHSKCRISNVKKMFTSFIILNSSRTIIKHSHLQLKIESRLVQTDCSYFRKKNKRQV